MNGIEIAATAEQAGHAADAEREELEWLLTSGALGRSGNLARVVKYICEERFAGRAQHLKEYSIATEALGRRPGFNPHDDTIVRVTMHSLRKRLQELYAKEGSARPLRLVIPPGRYEPTFVRVSPPVDAAPAPAPDESPLHPPAQEAVLEAAVAPPAEAMPAAQEVAPVTSRQTFWIALAAVVLAFLAVAGWAGHRARRAAAATSETLSPPPREAAIHALLGAGRQPLLDHSGRRWASGNYCQGENVAVPAQKIGGTLDPALYLGGVRGMAHCLFPVTQKLYEMHFLLAETSDLPAATRLASLSINAGAPLRVDVVDNAGGNGIATEIVVSGIVPENDGSIHVDFISEVSALDAVEILPTPSTSLLPVRIVMSPEPFTDSLNRPWSADRYFNGGRHGQASEPGEGAKPGLYRSERIGRFRYVIPAVPKAHYRVSLFFREPWFGPGNGGKGGTGSRVFDVSANGQLLLKDFDILAEHGTEPVVKTFSVEAGSDGRIELSFLPQTNYALVNAIEVLPED